jgi:hypothetical protein
MCQGLWKLSQPRSSFRAPEFVNESRQRLSKISNSLTPHRRFIRKGKNLGGDDVDILGLYSAKNFLALLKNQLLLAIIGDERTKLQAAAHGNCQVIDGSLENLHDNATRKYVLSLRLTPI